MKTYRAEPVHPLTWILFIIVIILIIEELVSAVIAHAPKHRAVSCETVKTYAQACAELPTHPGMDTNHDDKPCEKQFPHAARCAINRAQPEDITLHDILSK